MEKIRQICLPAQILAVSKLQTIEKIRHLYSENQRAFGENYVQEALQKQHSLKDCPDIQWHLIGHLQKNKVKLVVGRFTLIHSVDSLKLAEAINRQCESKGLSQDILLQVNLAEEDSKEGFSKKELLEKWPRLQILPHIQILGLMTMPPLTENPEDVRPYFRELAKLKIGLENSRIADRHTLQHLSMGTSHDFQVAIQEGATLVRLGTILFGDRPAADGIF